MAQYEIHRYDVWKDERGAYEIDGAHSTGRFVELSDKHTTTEILTELDKAGFFVDGRRPQKLAIGWEGWSKIQVYTAEDRRPLCELRRVDKEA